MGSRRDELCSGCKGVDKTGTRAGEIECPSLLRANFRLYQARARREKHIGRYRGNDDQIEFVRIESALLTKAFCGSGAQIACRLAFVCDPAFANAGSLNNPF